MHRSRAWIPLLLAVAVGCQTAPGATSATASPAPYLTPPVTPGTPASGAAFLTAYEFPASIDPADRYLFYLHGRIVEDQGVPAIDPRYGEYEYASILKRLADHGLVVISEQRAKDTIVDAYARRVVQQIGRLRSAGVPPDHITVVGASKGGWIAAWVSDMLQNRQVNFVLLGTCHPSMIEYCRVNHVTLYGNVLAISDAVDEYSGACEELFRMSEGTGLGRHEDILLHVGTGHGILYKPLDEWVLPTVNWAKQ
jgi:hypothetical protein